MITVYLHNFKTDAIIVKILLSEFWKPALPHPPHHQDFLQFFLKCFHFHFSALSLSLWNECCYCSLTICFALLWLPISSTSCRSVLSILLILTESYHRSHHNHHHHHHHHHHHQQHRHQCHHEDHAFHHVVDFGEQVHLTRPHQAAPVLKPISLTISSSSSSLSSPSSSSSSSFWWESWHILLLILCSPSTFRSPIHLSSNFRQVFPQPS